MYKKKRVREFRDDPSWSDEVQLKNKFDELDEKGSNNHQGIAEANLSRARFLHDNIIELLHRTNATITYGEIISLK